MGRAAVRIGLHWFSRDSNLTVTLPSRHYLRNALYFFLYILTIFSGRRVCPTHLYRFRLLMFFKISCALFNFGSSDHIIRSIMESVSFSYADMSVQVSDIEIFVLRNNRVFNGYYSRHMIITIITRGPWITYRSPEQLVLYHSILKRFISGIGNHSFSTMS